MTCEQSGIHKWVLGLVSVVEHWVELPNLGRVWIRWIIEYRTIFQEWRGCTGFKKIGGVSRSGNRWTSNWKWAAYSREHQIARGDRSAKNSGVPPNTPLQIEFTISHHSSTADVSITRQAQQKKAELSALSLKGDDEKVHFYTGLPNYEVCNTEKNYI